MRVRFRERALADVGEILDRLGEASPSAAAGFVPALEAAASRLGAHPRAGHPFPTLRRELRGLRTWPVPRFPAILLVYLPERGRVDVLRVLHGARDLGRIVDGRAGAGGEE